MERRVLDIRHVLGLEFVRLALLRMNEGATFNSLAFICDLAKMIRLTSTGEGTGGGVVAVGRFERALLTVNRKLFVQGARLPTAAAQFAQVNLKRGCCAL